MTTSIARFDPAIDWPADLDFTVTVNALTAFGNRTVEPISQNYTTGAQRMSIVGVTSAKAENLTVRGEVTVSTLLLRKTFRETIGLPR